MSDPGPALRRFVAGEGGDFEALALSLYAWQRAHNPQYDAICGDAAPSCWQEIPTVPVGLFRDLALTSFPADQARVIFRTSGTTAGRRGESRALDTALYDLGARRHSRAVLGPLPVQGVALVPYDADSSLGHMCQDLVPGMPTFFSLDRGLDLDGALAALAAGPGPLFVPGTAFALAELLAGMPRPLPLASGSILMVTGGAKGRVMTISEEALGQGLRARFPGARVVGEYGMTELSSQLWAASWGEPYTPPPWLQVKAVDPASGRRLPPGQEGLLSFVDLCNRWTVLAIETQDLGRVLPDGRVELRGRLPGAPARGCSLSVEEALERVGRL